MENFNNEFSPEALDELREILSVVDQKIQLPESLRGQNLIHLLPEEPLEKEKESIRILPWLLSKKAVPMYSLLAVAALALMILPRLSSQPVGELEMSPQQAPAAYQGEVSPAAGAEEQTNIAAYEEAVTDTPDSLSAEEAYTGEDLTMYDYQLENIPDNGTNESGTSQNAVRSGGTGEWEISAEEATSLVEGSAAASDTREDATLQGSQGETGGTEDLPQSRGVSPAMFSASLNSFVGSGEGILFYSRPADKEVPEESGYTLVLEGRRDETEEPPLFRQGISHLESIQLVSAADNRVAVLGTGSGGLNITFYTGFSGSSLSQEKGQNIPGTYLVSHDIDEYVYVFSSLADTTALSATTRYPLENTDGQGVFLITIVHTSEGTLSQVAVTGVTGDATFQLAEGILTVYYKDSEDIEAQKQFTVSGGVVAPQA